MRPLRRKAAPLCLWLAFTLIGLVWVLMTPPGAYPDGDAHYVRVVAGSRGQFVGDPYTGPALDGSRFNFGAARVFHIPAGFAVPPSFDCDAGALDTPSTCSYAAPPASSATTAISTAGTHSPPGYLLGALLARFAGDPFGAELAGRIASLLISLALLAAAIAMLWSRKSPVSPLLALSLTVTPTVLFLGGEVGPNGIEPIAAICFIAGMLRLSREQQNCAWWVWVLTGLGGATLALARPLGWVWLIIDAICCLLILGDRRLVSRAWRSNAARVGVAIAALGIVAAIGWQSIATLHPFGNLGKTLSFIPGVFDLVPKYISDLVGLFGSADTPLPQPLVEAWVVCIVIVAGAAIALGRGRERAGVVALIVATVVILVGYSAAFDSLAAGGLSFGQARYLLPFIVLVPLVSGEIVSRRATQLGASAPRRLFLGCAAAVAFVQVGSFYFDSRRYAVGEHGHLLFFLPGRYAWSPPEHWLPLLALALLGGALFIVAAVIDLRIRMARLSTEAALVSEVR